MTTRPKKPKTGSQPKPPKQADDPATTGQRFKQAITRDGKKSRSALRQAHNAARRGPVDVETIEAAIKVRRLQQAAQQQPTAAQPRTRGAPRAAPDTTQTHLWLPIGPTVVVGGQAGGAPRVAGRVRDVHVSPDGLRVYAATANGGVWFSDDGGESWRPLGGWTTTGTPPPIDRPAGVLACGCLLVRFGANAGADEVLVGTGELTPWQQGTPGFRNGGIGVLRAVGPSTSAMFAAPWAVEASNLRNLGIYRLAADPATATSTTFVAATLAGLWFRTGAPAAAWTQVAGAPFGGVSGAAIECTDVCWVRANGATPARLWVAVRDVAGTGNGLYVSTGGPTGAFAPVALPGLLQGSRITLANSPSNPAVLYALANGNLVWRLDDLLPTAVDNIPPNLLGTQANYDQALAVHPTRPERVAMGGAAQDVNPPNGDYNASMYLANVQRPDPTHYRYDFTPSVAANPATADAFIGFGVHPDVHCIRWVTVGARTELWIGCDGGVFRSPRGSDDNRLIQHSFTPRNNGIAALECGFIATHPQVPGHMLAGTQDNGTLERIGLNLWRARYLGDGGGVAYDPAAPQQVVAQYVQSAWVGALATPMLRTSPPYTAAAGAETTENGGASFYSGPDAISVPPVLPAVTPTSRLALGSYRVWFTPDWGTRWFTLPSLADPMVPGSQNANTDACVLAADGSPDTTRGQVIACRWATPTRLYVLCQREILRYDLTLDAAGPAGLRCAAPVPLARPPRKKPGTDDVTATTSPGPRLPEIGAWSDLAVHDPARGAHGSFYVACTGDPTNASMDTLWWFDGDSTWHATKLRTDPDATKAVPAPAYAVVVDRQDPNIVYVGTAVGVWKGVLSIGGPSWVWTVLSNGLPEASVQDLVLVGAKDTEPRLLRAAMQARGVWEVDLVNTATPARTLLRVHAFDTRHANPTALVDPTQATGAPALPWHASPDVRVMQRRGSRPPAFVRTSAGDPTLRPDPYLIWVFQTALHARGSGDALVKCNGVRTPLFNARLRAANSNSDRITRTVWNTFVGSGATAPDAFADPWNGSSPSEADLFELIVDRAQPAGAATSLLMAAVRTRVHVQVHHRHSTPAPAATVKVTLLRKDVTGTLDAAWATLPCAWTAAVQALLRTGGGAPALADGWTFADTTQAVRSPAADVDARLSRTVSFDVNLTGLATATRVLLVAVVHSDADPVTLTAGNLQAVVLGNRFVGVRSLEVG
ncbi:MAG: hypothetical protein ABI574_05830 [Burkholderiales bacterium]